MFRIVPACDSGVMAVFQVHSELRGLEPTKFADWRAKSRPIIYSPESFDVVVAGIQWDKWWKKLAKEPGGIKAVMGAGSGGTLYDALFFLMWWSDAAVEKKVGEDRWLTTATSLCDVLKSCMA
jgi:hypothetical protein